MAMAFGVSRSAVTPFSGKTSQVASERVTFLTGRMVTFLMGSTNAIRIIAIM
jgi:hypothetical protein